MSIMKSTASCQKQYKTNTTSQSFLESKQMSLKLMENLLFVCNKTNPWQVRLIQGNWWKELKDHSFKYLLSEYCKTIFRVKIDETFYFYIKIWLQNWPLFIRTCQNCFAVRVVPVMFTSCLLEMFSGKSFSRTQLEFQIVEISLFSLTLERKDFNINELFEF